jgi:hypothetical protein
MALVDLSNCTACSAAMAQRFSLNSEHGLSFAVALIQLRLRSAAARPGFDPGQNTPVFNTGCSVPPGTAPKTARSEKTERHLKV